MDAARPPASRRRRIAFIVDARGMGSELVAARGLREVADPYSGGGCSRCRHCTRMWRFVHAWRADPHGNIQMSWPPDHLADVDLLLARAASRVIVTVEQLVEPAEVVATPSETVLARSRSMRGLSPSAAPLRPPCAD